MGLRLPTEQCPGPSCLKDWPRREKISLISFLEKEQKPRKMK